VTQPPRPRALPSRRHRATAAGATSLVEAFGSSPGWPGAARLQELPIDTIRPNLQQPRKRFQEDALAALAASIRERGVLQPVLVRPLAERELAYELVAGERRWRAARMAGLGRLPAFIREDTDDASALELALIENAARQDLTPVEEARTLSTLINDLGVTQGALAERICRSRSDLANTLRLLDLPDDVLDLLDSGQLTKGHGKTLLREPTVDGRRALAQKARDGGWSVRHLERAIVSAQSTSERVRIAAGFDPEAQGIADQLALCIGGQVKVRRRRTGFAIELVVADAAAAEALVARLAKSVAHGQPIARHPTATHIRK
jgi:ParB family chromosome partitioning protein